VCLALLLLLFGVAPARAQRLLDLQVRTTATADALLSGAVAVFWNPAALAGMVARAEALVVDVRGPSATDVDGIALAGAYHIDNRTTVAAGFQHVGIESIPVTTTSPLRDPASEDIEIGEQVFGAAVARGFGDELAVGAVLRYARTADIAEEDGLVEAGGGAVYRPALPLRPALGLAGRVEEDGLVWTAGVDVVPPIRARDVTLAASYGVGGSHRFHGVSHRVAAAGAWRDRISVALGAAAEPDDGAHSWQPVLSAGLRLSRYSIGVLREELPNDFGAIHTLRLSVSF
jgi:hypothetical protein